MNYTVSKTRVRIRKTANFDGDMANPTFKPLHDWPSSYLYPMLPLFAPPPPVLAPLSRIISMPPTICSLQKCD